MIANPPKESPGSNVGVWEGAYKDFQETTLYGDTTTYRKGAEYLAGMTLIEDWGCGLGGMRRFVPREKYRGVDGSRSKFLDEIVDLTTYRSKADGIFMRAYSGTQL